MWGSQRELAFIWSHKTKELPVTSPAPPAATRDGGLGVWGMAMCGGEFACVGSVDKKIIK